jgi:hypothetical protein
VALVAAALAILLGACGTLPRNAVPTELMAEATIPGMPDVRAAAGRQSAAMMRDLEASFAQERPEDFPRAADLDSQRFIVWNMGLIAVSGRPEALDLFRKVMLASASVPVAFPPVLFEVDANGGRYD